MNHHSPLSSRVGQLLHAYTSRRSPWGPPWWIYAVAFGAANLVRQVVVVVTPSDIPQSIRVASWIATAVVVVAVVNGVAVVWQRRGHAAPGGHAPTLAPIWPLRRPDHPGRGPDATPPRPDRSGHRSERTAHSTSTPWAPWWVYVAAVVGANYLRRALLPDGSTPALRVVVALGFSAAIVVAVTIIHRTTSSDGCAQPDAR